MRRHAKLSLDAAKAPGEARDTVERPDPRWGPGATHQPRETGAMTARLDPQLAWALENEPEGPHADGARTMPLVDRHGKATRGTPGPGAYSGDYKFPTQFVPHTAKYERDGVHLSRTGRPEMGSAYGPDPDGSYRAKITDNAGSQVFTRAPAFSMGVKDTGKVFISPSHVADQRGTQSPGPVYRPATGPMPEAAPFGTAERSHEDRRYVSPAHMASVGTGAGSPGPKYHLREGKGIPGSLLDAPDWTFPTGPRSDPVPPDAPAFPGPGEYPPGEERDQRGGRFSPTRSRPGPEHDPEAHKRVFVSPGHGERENPEWPRNPGPGAYVTLGPSAAQAYLAALAASTVRGGDGDADSLRLSKQRDRSGMNPDWGRSRVSYQYDEPPRTGGGDRKPYLYEDLLPRGTADALYDTRRPWAEELEKNTRKSERRKETFGTGARAFAPELGGNRGGPVISQQHAARTMLCNAGVPGHIYDTGKYTDMARVGKGAPFAQGKRRDEGGEALGPGPGAYYPFRPPSPGVKIAHRYRHPQELVRDPDEPGPAQYDLPTTVRAPSPVRAQSPLQRRQGTFGWVRDRRSFIPATPGPGPGADFPADILTLDGPPRTGRGAPAPPRRGGGFTMGARTRSLVQYISTPHSQAEKRGIHSPGPKYAPGQAPRPSTRGPRGGNDPARPRSTFGYAGRDAPGQYMGTAFRGRQHKQETQRERTPGPGAYDSHAVPLERTKYKDSGRGTKFGTSRRPLPGNLTF